MTEEKDAYVHKLKSKIDECNAEIKIMEAQANRVKADAKTEYNKQIDSLRAKRKEVEEELKALYQSNEAAWEDLKKGLGNSWEILRKSFNKAKSEFRRGYKEGRSE